MVEASQSPTDISLRCRAAKLLRDVFTEKDGQTYDFIRIFGALGILWFMALESFGVAFKGLAFDPSAVCIGLSGLICSIGAGVAVRAWSKSESGTGS